MTAITGPVLPFAIDPQTGGVPMVSDARKLAQNVRVILATPTGARPMARGFGTLLRGLVQEPSDRSLDALLERQVREALVQIEPRIIVTNIAMTGSGASLTMDVTWTSAQSPQLERLSIPLGGL